MCQTTTYPACYPLFLVQGEPLMRPSTLPEGYRFQFFEPSLRSSWCCIQCSVQQFADIESAENSFQAAFSSMERELSHRMLFVLDPSGCPAATGILCTGHALGKPMGELRFLATVPAHQGKGLGRAMIAKLLELFYDTRSTNGIYLTIRSDNLRAIQLLRNFGFSPYLGRVSTDHCIETYDACTAQACWAAAEKQLAGFRHAPGTGESSGAPPFLFRRSSMFNKCQTCKVFELSAPTQSGVPYHSHDYAQIWYVTRGCIKHCVEGQAHEMLVGDAFLLPPNVQHSTTLLDGAHIICCEFYMEGLFPDNPDTYNKICDITNTLSFIMLFQGTFQTAYPKFTLSRKGQCRVEHLMKSMLDEYQQGDSFFDDYLRLLIIQLLITFQRESAFSPAHTVSEKVYDKYRSMVENAVKYIDAHYDEPLTLDDACKISMVSKSYFCYLFKLLTNQTFVEYLADRRIDHAMELLRQTNLPVTDIAQLSGFNDSTNFSRTFKRLKGISPREYRNAIRK